MRLPKEVHRLLDELSLAWELRSGKKHNLLYVDGRLLGILPHGSKRTDDWRALQNMLANIRRYKRQRLLGGE